MRELILIRHGQASFGAADYDQLSPLGERQARRVGERLAREQPNIFALHTGPRKRHLQTAQLVVAAARAAGADYPEPLQEDDLDELPIGQILRANGVGDDLLRSMMQAVQRWSVGELAPPGVATPAQFMTRIQGALDRLLPESDQPSVVVTSGGPIAVSLFRASALRDVAEAFTRGLQLANGSVTRLACDGAIWRLQPGDPVAHLPPDEITQV
jgi:broad specificity phosphatase PhoE